MFLKTRFPKSLSLASLLLCTLFLSLSARTAQAAPAEELPSGTQCEDAPQFGFTWLDTDVAGLVVTGAQKEPVIVTIEYLVGNPPFDRMLEGMKGSVRPIQRLGNSAGTEKCWDAPQTGKKEASEEKEGADSQSSRLAGRTLAAATTRASLRQARGALTFCVQPTAAGTMVPLFMERRALLKAGGYVGVSYFSTAPTQPANCEKKQNSVIPLKAMQKHRLSFDAGPVYLLSGDGSFKGHAEVAMSARSQWSTWFEGGVAMRYSAIGEIAEKDPETTPPAAAQTQSSGSPKDASDPTTFNPFTDGGGVLESNFYGMAHLPSAPWVGLAGGAGFTTVPGATGSELQTRHRWFVGFRSSVQGYNAGEPADRLGNSSGYIQLAYLKDELFQDVILDSMHPERRSDESVRWLLSGEIELPRLGTEWARISLRGVANIPRSGDGPSDIRISALVSIDPRSWFPGLKGKGLDLKE